VICAQCGEREAIVFIRRSGGSSEGCDLVLCESCSNRRGIIAGKGGLELNIDDLIGAGLDGAGDPARASSCPSCGLELGALRRERRLGCSDCAEAFAEELEKAMGRGRIVEADLPMPSPPRLAGVSRLKRELEEALGSEDYERAAALRDEISREGCEAPLSTVSNTDFPFNPASLFGEAGPDDDVVLFSAGKVYRDVAGLPFPGSPRGPSAPSRSYLLERIQACGGWTCRAMREIGPVGRRSLSERGIAPRGYAADDEAVVLSHTAYRAYALLDEGDHLRVSGLAPGLAAEAALAPALAIAELLGRDLDFARRPGVGWICARLDDCGLGCSLSATIHIPALVATGMRDRLFRALMAEGISLRGFYSASEDSAGSVYEIGMESSMADSTRALVASFSAAASRIVAAERLARTEISARGRGALVDAEGRAFGITKYFDLVGAEEAASLVSALRLAALRGSVTGVDPRTLGGLLLSLGAGSVALASGLEELPPLSSLDLFRARLIKAALSRAEYRTEESA
jgi:protein arginine kinase activator